MSVFLPLFLRLSYTAGNFKNTVFQDFISLLENYFLIVQNDPGETLTLSTLSNRFSFLDNEIMSKENEIVSKSNQIIELKNEIVSKSDQIIELNYSEKNKHFRKKNRNLFYSFEDQTYRLVKSKVLQ